MNEWIYSLDKIKVSQAGTPRHDNCVRLPVSWKPMRTIVKTSITNISYLVIKTYKNTYTKHNTQKANSCLLKLYENDLKQNWMDRT